MRTKEKFLYVLVLLCVVLGAAMRFIYTSVRFTGFLLWCGAGVLASYALLDRWSKQHLWAQRSKQILLLLVGAGSAFFIVLETWVISQSHTDWSAQPEAVVILGAGVNGTEPSLSLLSRLEAALDYLRKKPPDIPVVVTGAQGRGEEISEAVCMARWLENHGVEANRILLEEQAGTTAENVKYSKEILAERGLGAEATVAVVTSDYHLCRTAFLWGEGMTPVAAHLPARYLPLTVNYYLRDAFALGAELVF